MQARVADGSYTYTSVARDPDFLDMLRFRASRPPILMTSAVETMHAGIVNQMGASPSSGRDPAQWGIAAYLGRASQTTEEAALESIRQTVLPSSCSAARPRHNQHTTKTSRARTVFKRVLKLATGGTRIDNVIPPQ